MNPGRRKSVSDLISIQQKLKDAALSDTINPTELAQVARAWDTLENRKRILRGRPLPGSLKPDPRRPATRGTSYHPGALTPKPE